MSDSFLISLAQSSSSRTLTRLRALGRRNCLTDRSAGSWSRFTSLERLELQGQHISIGTAEGIALLPALSHLGLASALEPVSTVELIAGLVKLNRPIAGLAVDCLLQPASCLDLIEKSPVLCSSLTSLQLPHMFNWSPEALYRLVALCPSLEILPSEVQLPIDLCRALVSSGQPGIPRLSHLKHLHVQASAHRPLEQADLDWIGSNFRHLVELRVSRNLPYSHRVADGPGATLSLAALTFLRVLHLNRQFSSVCDLPSHLTSLEVGLHPNNNFDDLIESFARVRPPQLRHLSLDVPNGMSSKQLEQISLACPRLRKFFVNSSVKADPEDASPLVFTHPTMIACAFQLTDRVVSWGALGGASALGPTTQIEPWVTKIKGLTSVTSLARPWDNLATLTVLQGLKELRVESPVSDNWSSVAKFTQIQSLRLTGAISEAMLGTIVPALPKLLRLSLAIPNARGSISSFNWLSNTTLSKFEFHGTIVPQAKSRIAELRISGGVLPSLAEVHLSLFRSSPTMGLSVDFFRLPSLEDVELHSKPEQKELDFPSAKARVSAFDCPFLARLCLEGPILHFLDLEKLPQLQILDLSNVVYASDFKCEIKDAPAVALLCLGGKVSGDFGGPLGRPSEVLEQAYEAVLKCSPSVIRKVTTNA